VAGLPHAARDRLLAGPDWAPGDYAFTRSLGLPLYPDTVSQLMPKLIRGHNEPASATPPLILLPQARLHDLRHVQATVLLLAGVPVRGVADRLGHADAGITLRVRAHPRHNRRSTQQNEGPEHLRGPRFVCLNRARPEGFEPPTF
jgi:integrase